MKETPNSWLQRASFIIDISIRRTDTVSCVCGDSFIQRNSLPFVCLPVAVIVELIVGGERDEASPRSRQREEDLSGCIFPHLTEEGERRRCM